MNRSFFWGAVFGIAGSWAWHAWVRPLPSKKG